MQAPSEQDTPGAFSKIGWLGENPSGTSWMTAFTQSDLPGHSSIWCKGKRYPNLQKTFRCLNTPQNRGELVIRFADLTCTQAVDWPLPCSRTLREITKTWTKRRRKDRRCPSLPSGLGKLLRPAPSGLHRIFSPLETRRALALILYRYCWPLRSCSLSLEPCYRLRHNFLLLWPPFRPLFSFSERQLKLFGNAVFTHNGTNCSSKSEW